MNKEKNKWEIFKKTGKIEDYLEYKKQYESSISEDNVWKDLIWKILKQLELLLQRIV